MRSRGEVPPAESVPDKHIPPVAGTLRPLFGRLVTMVRIYLRHRRYAQALLWGLGGPIVYLSTQFFLWLDTIVYPNLRRMQLTEPVFIVGHPRSGTTFLQRQIYQTGRASMFRAWELWFPSLTQRLFFGPVISTLRQLGITELRGPDTGHEVYLDAVEEDEGLFLHRLDSETMAFICPWLLVDEDVSNFGLRVGWSDHHVTRKSIEFYDQCLKRQFVHTGLPHVVAKSTPSVFRLPELMERFPDARIIYVFRDPQESIRSFLAMHERYVGQALTDREARIYFQRKYEWGVHLYRTFEEVKSCIPEDQLMIVAFEDLVGHTQETMRRVLEFARIDPPGATLAPRRKRRKKHRNRPLEEFGVQPEQISHDLDYLRQRYARQRGGRHQRP